jgi:FixJ family two-component response regulator
MKGGARDFLTKPIAPESLLAAVESALTHGESAGQADDAQVPLSDRERVVLQGVVAGRINKEIAKELSLSERTIKSCRADVMRKLGANSLVDLIQRGTPLLQRQH